MGVFCEKVYKLNEIHLVCLVCARSPARKTSTQPALNEKFRACDKDQMFMLPYTNTIEILSVPSRYFDFPFIGDDYMDLMFIFSAVLDSCIAFAIKVLGALDHL